MPSAQCLGRLVKDTPKGVHMLEFEQGGLFHIPIRCQTMARNGDLCDTCYAKEIKTQERVREITGTTLKGMLPSYLMGRVTEPIPFWSRLYGGAWYNLKIESGCTISKETMAKAKKAAAVAYEGIEPVAAQPMPGTRKPRTKAAISGAAISGAAISGAAISAVEVPVVAAIVPAAAPVAIPLVKKRQPKQATVDTTPIAILPHPTEELPVETLKEIKVRKREIDGRSLYIGQKDKVYDLKFKYLGRLKEESIVDFPDSDEGM